MFLHTRTNEWINVIDIYSVGFVKIYGGTHSKKDWWFEKGCLLALEATNCTLLVTFHCCNQSFPKLLLRIQFKRKCKDVMYICFSLVRIVLILKLMYNLNVSLNFYEYQKWNEKLSCQLFETHDFILTTTSRVFHPCMLFIAFGNNFPLTFPYLSCVQSPILLSPVLLPFFSFLLPAVLCSMWCLLPHLYIYYVSYPS